MFRSFCSHLWAMAGNSKLKHVFAFCGHRRPQIKKVAFSDPKWNQILYKISNFRFLGGQVVFALFAPPAIYVKCKVKCNALSNANHIHSQICFSRAQHRRGRRHQEAERGGQEDRRERHLLCIQDTESILRREELNYVISLICFPYWLNPNTVHLHPLLFLSFLILCCFMKQEIGL